MKRKIEENTVLFLSTVKWLVLSSITGVAVGTSTAVFLKTLELSTSFSSKFSHYYLILPASLVFNAMLLKHLTPFREKGISNKFIEYTHNAKKMPFVSIMLSFTLPVLTISSGGSAGREAPAADVGVGIGGIISSVFRFNREDSKKLMICCVSASFASVFGTPIAGAIFGVEVLYIGGMLYKVIFPSLISGIIAYHTSSFFNVSYFYHPLEFNTAFSNMFLLKICVSGVFFGICSIFFIKTLKTMKSYLNKIKVSFIIKGLAGGILLVFIGYFFSRSFLGLGFDLLENSLSGQKIAPYSFLLKILTTSITTSFGGSGGLITPVFVTGATAGSFFSSLVGIDSQTMASIGLVCFLSGCANTPLSACILYIEMFGPSNAPYASVACIVSYIVTGRRSIFQSQRTFIKKSIYYDPEIKVMYERLSSYVENYLKKKNRKIGKFDRILFLLKQISKRQINIKKD